MADVPAILALEALSNRMWPAEQQMDYDGWLLQFAGGYTRRPNSAPSSGRQRCPLRKKRASARPPMNAEAAGAL